MLNNFSNQRIVHSNSRKWVYEGELLTKLLVTHLYNYGKPLSPMPRTKCIVLGQ